MMVFFLFFLVVDFGGTHGRLANSVVRTYPFFWCTFAHFCCFGLYLSVFHYGVSPEKNGGTYGRKLRSVESFGHEFAM